MSKKCVCEAPSSSSDIITLMLLSKSPVCLYVHVLRSMIVSPSQVQLLVCTELAVTRKLLCSLSDDLFEAL